MLTIKLTLPLIVAVVGALTYGLSSSKLAELGKYAFFAGTLAFLLGVR